MVHDNNQLLISVCLKDELNATILNGSIPQEFHYNSLIPSIPERIPLIPLNVIDSFHSYDYIPLNIIDSFQLLWNSIESY